MGTEEFDLNAITSIKELDEEESFLACKQLERKNMNRTAEYLL